MFPVMLHMAALRMSTATKTQNLCKKANFQKKRKNVEFPDHRLESAIYAYLVLTNSHLLNFHIKGKK